MSDLAGLRAVVIGGASGIGRAVVNRLSVDGALVGAVDVDAERLGAVGCAVTTAADATDPRQLSAAVDAVAGELEGLDALVHTIGVHDGFLTDLTVLDPVDLAAACDELLRVNVTSAVLAVRAALPRLQQGEDPSVTLTASEAAFTTRGGGPLYGASKWAVRGLVSHLAHLLAPGVRVNGVAPGGTTGTRLAAPPALGGTSVGERDGRDAVIREATALKVLIDPADVAAAYRYLVDRREARTVTGAIINVDGGRAEG